MLKAVRCLFSRRWPTDVARLVVLRLYSAACGVFPSLRATVVRARLMAPALAHARALSAPHATVTRLGDAEHADWWAEHDATLRDAWTAWAAWRDPLAYSLDNRRALHPAIAAALCKPSGNGLDDIVLLSMLTEVVPGVYAFPLFRAEFCECFLSELSRLERSGIPMRRPNGMNRHGAILSDLGFDALLRELSEQLVGPLGRTLYPEWCGPTDCAEQYGFTVRYKRGEDTALAGHSDTANVTLNVCLGRSFTGGNLYFKGVRFTSSAADETRREVVHRPGWAILHLGGHIHAAEPIDSGERINLIMWCQGPGGTVRIRPRDVASHSVGMARIRCG